MTVTVNATAWGTASNVTSETATTVTMASAGSIAVGDYLFLFLSSDNSGTNGAAPTVSITDPRGNTWTVNTASLIDPGAANAGQAGRICFAKVATGYVNGDALTINFGTATVAKDAGVYSVSGLHATTPVDQSQLTSSGGGAFPTTPTIGVSLTGNLCVAMCAIEGPNADSYVADITNTLGGSWVTLHAHGTSDATNTNNAKLIAVTKVPTTADNQAWGPDSITNRDNAVAIEVFAQAAAAGGPHSFISQYGGFF